MSTVTDWIQAGCAVLAFVGLVVYAYDTRQIRVATLAQSRASRRPFIAVASEGGVRVDFRNSGEGPALNVIATIGEGGAFQPEPIGAVPVAGTFHVVYFFKPIAFHFLLNYTIRFEYSDTAGARYWSTLRATDAGWLIDSGDIRPSVSFAQKLDDWNRRLAGDD